MRNLPQELEERTSILSLWMQNRKCVAAEIWRFRLTLSIFGMVLRDSDNQECLYVVCGGCDVLEAKTNWQNANLEVSLSNEQDQKFILRDREADLLVECYSVGFETEKPRFFDYSDNLANKGGTRAEGEIEINPTLFDETRHRHIELDSRLSTVQESEVFLETHLARMGVVSAEIWSYRADSRVLDIRLQSRESALNLHMACCSCHFLKTKKYLPSANMKIRQSHFDSGYILQDADNDWSVGCDFVLLTTNVKPQFGKAPKCFTRAAT